MTIHRVVLLPTQEALAQERAAYGAQVAALQANLEKLAGSQQRQIERCVVVGVCGCVEGGGVTAPFWLERLVVVAALL
jgi:hypothetical protein